MRMTSAQLAEYTSRRAAKPSRSGSDNKNVSEGRERDLHAQIASYCKAKQWIAFHGSMAHRAMRTAGEPDYVIIADGGRVFFVECKTRLGKLTPEQAGIVHWAERLGTKIHVVRSMDEFLEIVK